MRLYRPVFRVFVLTLLTLPWAGSLVSRAQVPERTHGQHASATASELRNTPVTLPAPEAPDAVGRLFAAFNDTLGSQIAAEAVSRLFAAYNDTLGASFMTDAASRLFAVSNDTLGASFSNDAASRLFAVSNDTLGTQIATDAVSRMFSALNDTSSSAVIVTDAVSRLFTAYNDTTPGPFAAGDAVSRLVTAYNDTVTTTGPTDAMSRLFAAFNSQLIAPRAASTVRDTIRFDWSPTSGFDSYRLYVATAASAGAIFDSVSVGSDTTAAYATGLADGVRYFARLGGSVDGGSSFTDFSPFNSGTLIDQTAPQTSVATGPAPGGYTNAEPVLLTFTGTDNGSSSDGAWTAARSLHQPRSRRPRSPVSPRARTRSRCSRWTRPVTPTRAPRCAISRWTARRPRRRSSAARPRTRS